jgi:hypothetical protein
MKFNEENGWKSNLAEERVVKRAQGGVGGWAWGEALVGETEEEMEEVEEVAKGLHECELR